MTLPIPILTAETFRQHPDVLRALANPRSPRSVLNYICGCDTADPEVQRSLNTDEGVGPLLSIWFASGKVLDDFCQPFAPVVRQLKSAPASLRGGEWESLEGKVAKVLLGDQLSRSCFRGTAEAFSCDPIARQLVRELVSAAEIKATLKLPAAILYLLPWALAHSEDLADLERACEVIDMAIKAYPNFKLFEGRNKQAVDQHRQVLQKFGRYPQRNTDLGRPSTEAEKAWLNNKDNLPTWAGGNLSFDQPIK
jgi:uncharacterized protein (DUF924 family)